MIIINCIYERFTLSIGVKVISDFPQHSAVEVLGNDLPIEGINIKGKIIF